MLCSIQFQSMLDSSALWCNFLFSGIFWYIAYLYMVVYGNLVHCSLHTYIQLYCIKPSMEMTSFWYHEAHIHMYTNLIKVHYIMMR